MICIKLQFWQLFNFSKSKRSKMGAHPL